MTMRMLIDARHQEETRVAVIKGNRIEEFDFESAEHKQLKGNIYLAKVTRVEPSLQAAFIDYGGNRHGFLAFSEIHPDYYQIPKEDREALLREEAEHAAEEAALRAAEHDEDDEGGNGGVTEVDDAPMSAEDDNPHQMEADDVEPVAESEASAEGNGGDESAADALRRKRQNLRRRYKIQDVIRRRQVLLVQVVKEERGNKGAALTTYLSLAGRYCVLMPNTSHGGGISRKISSGADRKRLKQVMSDLALPTTMGLIVRTAGLERTKTEIKRDFDYLARLWDEIRDTTLKSSAPALVYQDNDLIKRAIRDIYNRDIDEIFVEGEDGYRQARAYMKLLMPSHVKRVTHYADAVPLFQRYGAEDQLSAMYQPVVQLKSGGYLVINPTEALVSIDINSGRSTREHNIEQTAYNTNIEAAHEIARQLRLRDMAGLVVIDFIDMESNGHIRKVEKAMKEALKNDRARIQVGRISSFGLMEMSRQRLRTGVLEASTHACPHCEGTGLMRTASSSALSALRMLEEEAARGRGSRIVLRAGREAAVYLLNRKRDEIVEVEQRYGVSVDVLIEEQFEGARMAVESAGPPPAERPRPAPIAIIDDEDDDVEDEAEAIERDDEDEGDGGQAEAGGRDEEQRGDARRRRRRRGRRGGKRRERTEGEEAEDGEAEAVAAEESAEPVPADPAGNADVAPVRKARRRPRARSAEEAAPAEQVAAPEPVAEEPVAEEPVKPKRGRRRKADADAEVAAPPEPVEQLAEPVEKIAEPAPAANDSGPAPRRRTKRAEPKGEAETAPSETEEPGQSGGGTRRGWWQRTFGA